MDIKNVKKEYTNGEITVVWESSKCIHSGMCVRTLPTVFQPKESPWIKIDNALSQEIMDAVGKCPSRALSMKESKMEAK